MYLIASATAWNILNAWGAVNGPLFLINSSRVWPLTHSMMMHGQPPASV